MFAAVVHAVKVVACTLYLDMPELRVALGTSLGSWFFSKCALSTIAPHQIITADLIELQWSLGACAEMREYVLGGSV